MLQNWKNRRGSLLLILSLLLALALALSPALADNAADQVRVTVENRSAYTMASGAAWEGTLVDATVDLNEDSTMMSCVVAALGSYSQSGAESNYISEINGLSAGESSDHPFGGWMMTLNDWFINEGAGAFTAAGGTLHPGDHIRVVYSTEMGEDLGGSWANNDKTLQALSCDVGALTPSFSSDVTAYTLTLPAGMEQVTVTPTATNKNFQVRMKVDDGDYLRHGPQTLAAADGSVITVTCGLPGWPSMNQADDVPAVSYTVTLAMEAAANTAPTLAAGVNASGNTADATVGAPWTLDLAPLFTDAEGDDLTYAVQVNGGDYAPTEASYSFTPAEPGVTRLTFKANDGQADSTETYSVTVTAAEIAFAIREVDGDATTPVPNDGYSYWIGDSAKRMLVVQTAGGPATVSYQWKKSTSATGNLSNISKQTNDSYLPDISSVGQTWYACQITYTPEGGSGSKQLTTDRVRVSVDVTQSYIDGKKPVFAQQPVGGTWDYGDRGDGESDFGALLISALDTENYSATDNRNLKVKWYISNDDGATWEETTGYGQSPISGDTLLPLYELPVGSYKCKCIATLSMKDLAGTEHSAATTSDVVDVTIRPVSAWEGEGTESNPYLLKTTADLEALSAKSEASSFNGIYFKIVDDITLPTEWKPIGTTRSRFAGNIDGDNHLLTIPAGEKALLGCTVQASLKNLCIKGERINGNGVVDIYTTGQAGKTTITIDNVTLKEGTQTLGSGFVSGYSHGNAPVFIRNCTVEAGVVIGYDGTRNNVGSFGGDFNGKIENCVSYATVQGVNYVGGICGNKGQTMGDYEITNCTFGGTVTASGNFAGGVSGGGYGGTQWGVASAKNTPCAVIKNCLVTGSVSGADQVGGILGSETGVVQAWENGIGYIQDNVFAGTLQASADNAKLGGIVGYMNSLNKYTVIENNYYLSTSAERGIGAAQFVDTSFAEPTAIEGTTYFSTQGGKPANAPAGVSRINHNRTDDPLGADADALTKAVTAAQLKDGSVTALLNGSDSSLGNWVQGESTPVHGEAASTIQVDVAVYDYTAKSAGLSGASENGVILEDAKVMLWEGAKAVDAFVLALTAVDIPYAFDGYGYFSTINGLGPDGNYPQSGWMFSINDDYGNLGTQEQPIASGDQLELHYSLTGYGADVGSFFAPYRPTITSFTLAGETKALGVVTTAYADWQTTFTDTVEFRVDDQVMTGDGSAANPFVIPFRLPVATDLSAQTAAITTDLHPNYWSLVSGEDQADVTQPQDYSKPVRFAIQTRGGVAKTYYQVVVSPSDNGSCLFTLTPADAAVQLFDADGAPVQPDAGNAKLFTGLVLGEEYTYTVAKDGYISASGSITAVEDGAESVTLEKENTAPTLANPNNSSATANIQQGQSYKLDLAALFTDEEDDALTYTVAVNGASAVNAAAEFAFTPAGTGSYTLVFRASDGQLSSEDAYSVTLTVHEVVRAEITLTMQQTNSFLLTPHTVQVASDLAESYGYTDRVADKVSTLDVLVKSHELLLETDFTPETATDYLAIRNSMVVRVCGEDTYNFSFAVNGAFPYDPQSPYGAYGYTGYAIDQAAVDGGDLVDFFFYQDSMCMDMYTWFSQAGERVDELTVTAGQSFSLTLEGFMFMFGSYTEADLKAMDCWGPIEDAQLATVDPVSGRLTALEDLTTDENGQVILKLEEPGVYVLSASTDYAETYQYITSPWLQVTVVEKGDASDVIALWKNFRNSDVNMAITDAPTPVSAEATTLLWANKLGTNWSNTPSIPIIVDNALVVMSGRSLCKLDLTTGEVKAQAEMVAAPSFSYTPPTYGEGMIFCPLGGGRIQAFDAKTLESLWVYTDARGGQAQTPITYSDGYVYTGFWSSEVGNAAYVCVSVTDEDPQNPSEAKTAAWRDEVAGGFYWAGSLVLGDTVVYASDNGVADATSAGSRLVSRDKTTGRLLSSLELLGDARSTVAYDAASGRVFGTSKGGYLYSAALNSETGILSDLKLQSIGAQSTSTPVVYKGRVYLGCGSGISATGSAGNLLVCDADSLETLYAVGMLGYPQCSMLLSTAYEQSEGYLYLYSTYNMTPGGVSLIKVKPEAVTGADAQLIEVFTPEGNAQNYGISSLICDPAGTLYYKNDSGNVFALQGQYPITAETNGHGAIQVTRNGEAVSQAPAGAEIAVSVTANTGWQLRQLTLNGENLPLNEGRASFPMPQGPAALIASYTQTDGVLVQETGGQGAISDSLVGLSEKEKTALKAMIAGTRPTGLATATNSLVQPLVNAHPDHELRIDLYLDIRVIGAKLSTGVFRELTLEITPRYALYLDGAAEPAETGVIENEQLAGPVQVSLAVPEGMTLGDHSRVLHGEERIPYSLTDSGRSLVFSVRSFSPFVIQADARIASVAYDLQGGKLDGSSATVTFDYYPEDEGASLPTPSRKGYDFRGWYSQADGKGERLTKVSADLPETAYAYWEAVTPEEITVTFRLIGDEKHKDGVRGHDTYITWIKTTKYQMPEGSTVYDLFILALKDAGLSHKGAEKNYVSEIKAPKVLGGFWLGEFDNGENSGWMYTVNGDHPGVGLMNCVLEDGDKVIWHYTDDYTLESESHWNSGSEKYLNRWLEAEDITPERYVQKYADVSKILSVGTGGSVSPRGSKLQDYLGKKVTFTVTPDSGYQVKDVVLDGKSLGPVTSFVCKELTTDTRIKVTFEPLPATAPGTQPGTESAIFPDVPASHWASAYVNALARRSVITGYPDGYFYPSGTVTRADFVTMLSRLSGQALPLYGSQFSDVTADRYYARAVAWAAAAGITLGDGQGHFLPQAFISRQEMAAMLYRYAAYMGITLPRGNGSLPFTDSSSIFAYAVEPVSAMNAAAILQGYPDGSFRPLGNATRAEAAKMLYLLDAYR